MRRSLLLMFLAILVITGACKKDGQDPGRKDPSVPTVAPMVTTPVEGPAGPSPPEPIVPRTTEGLGKLIDHFNTCVSQVAELVRAADDRPVVGGKTLEECDRAFAGILETRGVKITEPYTEYFVLAARVSRRFTAAVATADPASSFQVTEFVADYNRLALLNNELLGVPVTEPPAADMRRHSVPRRTYRDELARHGEAWGKAVLDWQFGHPFETLGSGAPAAWLADAQIERTRLWLLRLELEHQVANFSHVDCDNAGTGPEEKIACDPLVSAGADLVQLLRAWIDAWDRLLADLARSGQTPPADVRRVCEVTLSRLEERIRELPARVE